MLAGSAACTCNHRSDITCLYISPSFSYFSLRQSACTLPTTVYRANVIIVQHQ